MIAIPSTATDVNVAWLSECVYIVYHTIVHPAEAGGRNKMPLGKLAGTLMWSRCIKQGHRFQHRKARLEESEPLIILAFTSTAATC